MLNKSKLNVYFSLALIIGGFLVWKNVLNNQFLYDDDTFVVLNENIRTLTPLTKFFTPAASSNNPQMNRDVWRPLTTFSYALNYKLSGLNPKSFHLVNLLIHIINGLVIFWLVFLLTKKEIPAFFTAMVFLIHPVQTETVAWVSQRSNILFLFFYLLSLIFYIKRQKSSILFNLFSILCFILSLLSKEMAISLPLIILAYEYILNRQKFFSAFYRSLPYFIILFFFVMIRSTVIGQTAQTTYWAGGFVPQMLTMVKGFAYYVKLMFVPCPLSAEYLFPVKYAVDVDVALYGIILAGIIYLGLRLRTTRPIISFGIFLFLLSLVPVSNIIPIRTIINERFLYPAVIGFGLILGSGLIEVFKSEFNRKYLRCIPVLALFIAYSFISINRNNDWKDHWSFVTANLKTCPQSATLHYGMGRAYASKGMYEEASKEFELCLKIDPQYDDATSDLGRLSAKTGNIDEAIEKYRQTVHKRVDFFDGLNNLGLAYFNKGNYEEAVKTLEKACKIKPADLEAKTNLATAYAYYGDFDKAIELCKEILKENPKMEKTSRNLKLFMEARSKIIEPNIKENQNKVTKFIQKKFHDPVVRESIMHSAGVEFENTKGGITLKKGYLGSSQSKDELNPAEIQALESMKKRETASASNENQPKFVFSENMKNGYTVKYNGEAISVKHLNSDSNVETETGVLVYKNAYQSTDVLYVFGNNQCQEMILLRNEKSPAKFEYEYSKKININSKGEIEVSGLSLSKPVIFDSDGKKINGTYQKTSDNRVLLSFNKENLKYPLLIDPTWRTTNSMTTVRAWHTATLLPNGKVLITGGWNGSYLSTAELYDPSAGTFSNTGSMSTARQHHAATLLPSGKVLITGGFNGSSGVISTVELYDPSAGTFSNTGSMTDT
ncbi:MAG: tetratricopeptide repeat protein, partial [Elusimicrobiota bacterium]|nr:tetratricopeptide repeat protein [Elusimicrobiota bacterium]